MTNVVDTVTRLVTTNDELIGSIEGIECIMIEAIITIILETFIEHGYQYTAPFPSLKCWRYTAASALCI
jgi:hypothetical protein